MCWWDWVKAVPFTEYRGVRKSESDFYKQAFGTMHICRIHVIVKSVIQGPGVPLCIGQFMMVRERQQGRVRKTQFCARVVVECLQE